MKLFLINFFKFKTKNSDLTYRQRSNDIYNAYLKGESKQYFKQYYNLSDSQLENTLWEAFTYNLKGSILWH